MNNTEELLKAADSILGKPALVGLNENTYRIRRNLVVASTISLFISAFEVGINPASTFLGIQFVNLTNITIISGLMIMLMYFSFHYCWALFESFYEWKLRVTGTNYVYEGGFTHGDIDNVQDVRRSTLYYWWRTQRQSLQDVDVIKLQQHISELENYLISRGLPVGSDEAVRMVRHVNAEIARIGLQVQKVHSVVSNERLFISIARFDNHFKVFMNIQNVSWLLFDVIVPLGMSSAAMYCLCLYVFSSFPTVLYL